ncbi:exopolysaccharide biosynthesis protein [Pararhodobacter zhoushanensis]|uniref:exopolysaccharide biosynthesis protein n=1 Tax=Pararhodobacter zhoushanensis TaxID=2479545 RepID=UPI000F8DEF0D|nr:exopolysaccharide biosynthesis protein [Pararhodobacter zhoushanensis]
MGEQADQRLSDVLETLDASIDGERVSVEHVVETLGAKSFPALILIFSLIAVSPASAVPGVTTVVAVTVFLLAVQMMARRDRVWLPQIITRQEISSAMLSKGLRAVRRPALKVEGLLKARLTFLCHRPLIWLPLSLIALLTLFMPFMELVPASGSIAAAAIALCAAGLLTRDGLLVILSALLLAVVPVAVYLGLSG